MFYKKSKHSVVIVLISFFLLACSFSKIQSNFSPTTNTAETVSVYVVKNYWHTGIIIPINDSAKAYLQVLSSFTGSKYVDIGFGDRAFYLNPSNDPVLAARAILVPTESTIRIAEEQGNVEDLKKWSDYLIRIKLTSNEFNKLCKYIDNSFSKDKTNNPIIIEERAGGTVRFYESNQKYHLFNTCNTWAAKALRHAGLEYIQPFNVVTSRNLFSELEEKAEILKEDKSTSIF